MRAEPARRRRAPTAAPNPIPAFASVPTAASRSAPTTPAAASPPSSVPESLAEKIRAAQGMPGERKQVTVLFCDLAGSTAVAERPRPGGLPRAARPVRRARAARGLPLRGHRQPALRRRLHGALRRADRARGRAAARGAARRWRSATRWRISTSSCERERGVALPARIGINTGPVVVGTVGNDLKMDYTAIGDTTNLAARLESLADAGHDPDQRGDGAAGARLLRACAQVGPLEVKGKSEPVAAFEVLDGARARPTRWRSRRSAG